MTPLEATVDELKRAGIPFEVTKGKRHDKVWFEVRGKSLLVVVSRSSSDHRAGLNARLTVRREVRRAIQDCT